MSKVLLFIATFIVFQNSFSSGNQSVSSPFGVSQDLVPHPLFYTSNIDVRTQHSRGQGVLLAVGLIAFCNKEKADLYNLSMCAMTTTTFLLALSFFDWAIFTKKVAKEGRDVTGLNSKSAFLKGLLTGSVVTAASYYLSSFGVQFLMPLMNQETI